MYRLISCGRIGERDEMTLVTEVWCISPATGGFAALRPITEMHIGTVCVVFLRRVLPLVVRNENVQDWQTGTNQANASLGVTEKGVRIWSWRDRRFGNIPRQNDTHENNTLVFGLAPLEHQHESVETEGRR